MRNYLIRIAILLTFVFRPLAWPQDESKHISQPDRQRELTTEERLKVLNEAWELVRDNFYDPKLNGVAWGERQIPIHTSVRGRTDGRRSCGLAQTIALDSSRLSHRIINAGRIRANPECTCRSFFRGLRIDHSFLMYLNPRMGPRYRCK